MVSIITICYNAGDVIHKTFDGMLKQTYTDVEYIIVDGASKDNTMEVIDSYRSRLEAKFTKVIVISEKDNGIYDAMNKGIRHASGDIVGIINSGDWYEPNAIQLAADTYAETNYDYFCSDSHSVLTDGTTVSVRHVRIDKYPTSLHWNHPSSFVPKRIYNEIGLFRCEGGIYDDFDFYLRVRKKYTNIVFKNIDITSFTKGGISQRKTFKLFLRRLKDRIHCYLDNGYSPLYIIPCLITEVGKLVITKKPGKKI